MHDFNLISASLQSTSIKVPPLQKGIPSWHSRHKLVSQYMKPWKVFLSGVWNENDIVCILWPLFTFDSSNTISSSIFSSCSLIKVNFSAAVFSMLAVHVACELFSSWQTRDSVQPSVRLRFSLSANLCILALGGRYSGEPWPVIVLSLSVNVFWCTSSNLLCKEEKNLHKKELTFFPRDTRV